MGRQFKPGQLQTGSLYNISSSYALTASYALNGGAGGSGFPFSGSAVITGSLLVTGGITGSLYGTASFATTASYVTNLGSGNYTQSFSNQSTWTVIHNLQTRYVIVQTYDNNYDEMIPQNIDLTDSNTVTITFPTQESGTAVITVGGALQNASPQSASYALYAETALLSDRTAQIDIYVKNQSGADIPKGVVVRITGSNNSSDIPRIVTASYENDNNSANTLGITRQSITNDTEGYVITEGILTGIDTSTFQSGQLLYLGATGSIIGAAPVAPLHAVRLGEVIRSQQINGSIYVRIDNGYEIQELHDVYINTASVTHGDLLMRSSSVWINTKQLSGSYSITGSLQGNVSELTISSNTASLDLNQASFFTLQLIQGTNTYINPSNIRPGLTATMLISTTGSATVSFPTSVKQPSGSAYIPTTTIGKDVLTFISYDAATLYVANVKNMI